MTDATESKKAKDRSPSFPFITLERALARAAQFYAEERRGVTPYTRAVMHWNYSESSSGGLQTVAALKAYGLLNESGGSGKARQLQLSDLALRIVLDKRPEDEAGGERRALIRRAALSPAVAAEVHDRWPDRLPSPTTLHHFLVVDKKFNVSAADTAIKILKENQEFAGLDSDVVSSAEGDSESDMGNEADAVDLQQAQRTSASSRAPRLMPASHGATIARQEASPAYSEHILHDGGQSITLTFSLAPTSDAYEYLKEFAEFRAGTLKRREQAVPKPELGPPTEPPDSVDS